MSDRVFDVAIIGYGPAGATLANLLGQYGLSVLVLEREADIYPLPRAIHFDGEVMRVFETAGLRREVEAISRPGLKGMYFNNAAGETLLIRGGTSARGPHGCATNHYFHQPELETVLRAGLRRYPRVEVRTQHEVTRIEDGAEHAMLEVKDLVRGNTYAVQAPDGVGTRDASRPLYVEDHLYDRRSDPHELDDRVADPAYSDVRAALRGRLLDFLREVEGEAPRIVAASPEEEGRTP